MFYKRLDDGTLKEVAGQYKAYDFIGTKDEYNRAVSAGKIKAGMVVFFTDDYVENNVYNKDVSSSITNTGGATTTSAYLSRSGSVCRLDIVLRQVSISSAGGTFSITLGDGIPKPSQPLYFAGYAGYQSQLFAGCSVSTAGVITVQAGVKWDGPDFRCGVTYITEED